MNVALEEKTMMMKTAFGTVVMGLVGTALVLSGCTSTNKETSGSAETSSGMMCPKCETVWITRVTDQGTKMQRLSSERSMTCPDCDAMAKAYLEEGKMVLHECPMCKVTPMKMAPAPQPTHPKGTHS